MRIQRVDIINPRFYSDIRFRETISYGSYRPFVTRGIFAITGEENARARARRKQGIKKGVAVL